MIFASSNEKFLFYKIPTCLFILLPLTLISGPFLSDLSVTLIAILFLIYSFKRNEFEHFKNVFFYLFIIFCLYLLINSIFINFDLTSIKISIFYFRFGVFVIAVIVLIRVNNSFVKYFYYCLILSFAILIIDGYFQYFSGENLFGMELSQKNRVSSLFGEELILGSFVSRLFPIFLGLSILYFSKIYYQKLISFIFIILLYGLVFISGERTSFFFINMSILFIFLLTNKSVKYKSIVISSSILIVLIITFFNDNAKKRLIDLTIKQTNIHNLNNTHIFSIQHTHHYITAYKIFLDNKMFGVGVKKFRKVCSEEKYNFSKWSCSNHPHNSYIQLLSETGLIGFSFMFSLLLFLVFKIFKHLLYKFRSKEYFSNYQVFIISAIVISIWPLAPSGNIFNNWLSIIYYLSIPLLLLDKKKT